MSRQESSKKILSKVIREYYSLRPLEEPLYLPSREIAIYSLEDEKYIRHMAFPSMAHLYKYILYEKTPIHLYYSAAYYDNPLSQSMEQKGWQGSDLIFDIDSDHYPGCDKTISICLKENKIYEGKIKECPKTGEKPIIYSIVTIECVRRAWQDIIKLVDILRDEIGFHEIKIYFSGNRGFHVKVQDEEVRKLTTDERREIASYLTLQGIDLERIAPPIGARRQYVLFSKEEYGIRRRIVNSIIALGDYTEYRGLIKVPYETLMSIVDELKVDIDIVVTIDPSRLSRFGYSINGKSGLTVCPLSRDTLVEDIVFENFNPWLGKIKVKPLVDITGLEIYGRKFNLRRGMVYDIEAYRGLHLAFKGLVEIIDINRLEVRKCTTYS